MCYKLYYTVPLYITVIHLLSISVPPISFFNVFAGRDSERAFSFFVVHCNGTCSHCNSTQFRKNIVKVVTLLSVICISGPVGNEYIIHQVNVYKWFRWNLAKWSAWSTTFTSQRKVRNNHLLWNAYIIIQMSDKKIVLWTIITRPSAPPPPVEITLL